MGDQYLFLKQFSIFLPVSITASVYTVTIPFVLQRVIKRSTVFIDLLLIPIVSHAVASKKNFERKKDFGTRKREKGSDVAACKLSRNKYEIYEKGDSTLCEVVSAFCQLRYVHEVMLHSVRIQTQGVAKLSNSKIY